METWTRIIGSFVMALFIIAIPILCGLSYGLGWLDGIKWLLTLSTIGECLGIWFQIADMK